MLSLKLTHPLKSSTELARFLCHSWATCSTCCALAYAQLLDRYDDARNMA